MALKPKSDTKIRNREPPLLSIDSASTS
ncbi:hypothetical protein CCACVL1_00711 [Corchorus capsularis]|uniref:Uncharacterized protein n=1 Tax=Corchorus capsularis TaxID=210143 RepID=A0A1R3KVH0_COCAP|nr:hypothetical protein CCACVL1_00711 [Corchorus capsularis]